MTPPTIRRMRPSHKSVRCDCGFIGYLLNPVYLTKRKIQPVIPAKAGIQCLSESHCTWDKDTEPQPSSGRQACYLVLIGLSIVLCGVSFVALVQVNSHSPVRSQVTPSGMGLVNL